jgi:predicted nucleic acid-binding protein
MPETTADPRDCALDTNVFVAAGFNRDSDSAWILQQVERGSLRLIWNEETRRETERIVRKIPPLSWESIAPLFREENCCREETRPEQFLAVPDPEDRKFAALAEATGATLVTLDGHLLQAREGLDLRIVTPSGFRRQLAAAGQADEEDVGARGAKPQA